MNDKSLVRGVFTGFSEKCSSAMEAELRALDLAISLACSIGAPRVIFETDSTAIIHLFYGHYHSPNHVSPILDRCWSKLARQMFLQMLGSK